MKTAALIKDGVMLIEKVELAVWLPQRVKGLLGRKSCGPREAIWLAPCFSIHTYFMRFNIDVFFLDRDMRIVGVVRNVRPWRIIWGGKGAKSTLETAGGSLSDDQLKLGDRVFLVNC